MGGHYACVVAIAAILCCVEAAELPLKHTANESPRKIGDGFNSPFQPSNPEHDISSNFMDSNAPERRDSPQDDVKVYYKPVKSDPLLDDESDLVRLDIKSNLAYSHQYDDDTLSNSIDVISTPHKDTDIVDQNTFTAVFKHLFEIIQDVLNIMRQMYYPLPSEKSDDGSPPDTWPLLKSVFIRYLRLVKETELLVELREIIPVDDLMIAVETEDGDLITKAIINSFNPNMFSYICQTIKDLIMPLAHFTDTMAVPELRQYMPSPPSLDITWPIRYVVRRSLNIVGPFFSRRELRNLWQDFRSYSPFTARSLEYIVPLEEEEPISTTVSIDDETDASEGRFLSNPYFLLAGFGSTVLATVVAYTVMGSAETEPQHNSRNKRDIPEPLSPIMESNSNIASLVKILESVDPNSEEINRLTQGIKEAKPKKSYKKKFDPLRKLVNYASKNLGLKEQHLKTQG